MATTINHLPVIAFERAFSFLSYRDRCKVAATCRMFASMIMNPNVLSMQYGIPATLGSKLTKEQVHFFEIKVLPNLFRYLRSISQERMNAGAECFRLFSLDRRTIDMSFAKVKEPTTHEILFVMQFGLGNQFEQRHVIQPVTILIRENHTPFRLTYEPDDEIYRILHIFEACLNAVLCPHGTLSDLSLPPEEARTEIIINKLHLESFRVIPAAMRILVQLDNIKLSRPRLAKTTSAFPQPQGSLKREASSLLAVKEPKSKKQRDEFFQSSSLPASFYI